MKPYHKTLEPTAEPIVHPPQSVMSTYIVQELYKQEIDKMLELGVITRVDTPTNWVTVLSFKSQLKIREKSQS